MNRLSFKRIDDACDFRNFLVDATCLSSRSLESDHDINFYNEMHDIQLKYGYINNPDNQWKIREYYRTKLVYPELPDLGLTYNPDHFVHVSVEQPNMIAFTENADKGKIDIQMRIKYGKYLKNYSGLDLTDKQIAQYANEWLAQNETYNEHNGVRFAETREEIRKVYDSGIRSCMDSETYPSILQRLENGDHIDGFDNFHPCEVYANEHTAIAYYLRNDRIVARTVIRKDSNKYIRIYGDETALKSALQELGYQQGTLEGIKLPHYKNDNCDTICPYIDGTSCRVTINDDHLLISENGELGNPDHERMNYGEYNGETWYCERCENELEDDQICRPHNHDSIYCEECINENYTWAIVDNCGGEGWIVDEEVFYCESDNNHYSPQMAEYYLLMYVDDIGYLKPEDYFYCAVNEDYFHIDHCIITINGDTVHIDEAIQTVDGDFISTDDYDSDIHGKNEDGLVYLLETENEHEEVA